MGRRLQLGLILLVSFLLCAAYAGQGSMHAGKLGKTNLKHSPFRSGRTKAGKRFYRRGLVIAMVHSGSLKANVTRIAHQFGWSNVVWLPDTDYRWYGKVRVVGYSLPDVFEKLLHDYPLQARFYEGNHVLAIVPRTLQ